MTFGEKCFFSSMILISCIFNSWSCLSSVVSGHIPYILLASLSNLTFFFTTYTKNASSILELYFILNLSTRSEKLNTFVKEFSLNQASPRLSTSHLSPEFMTPSFVARYRKFSDFSILSQYAGSHITNVDDPVSIMICFFVLMM